MLEVGRFVEADFSCFCGSFTVFAMELAVHECPNDPNSCVRSGGVVRVACRYPIARMSC